MDTNNPPNVKSFAKKPTVRNQRRLPKHKSYKKTAGFNPMSKDEIAAFKYLHTCFFLIIVATSLKEVFGNQNAE